MADRVDPATELAARLERIKKLGNKYLSVKRAIDATASVERIRMKAVAANLAPSKPASRRKKRLK